MCDHLKFRVRSPNNVGRAVQTDLTLLDFYDHGTKEMLGVVS